MEDEQGAIFSLESKLRDKNAEPADLPLSLFKVITENFSDKHEIGRGGFGVVYKGVLRHGEVAVKKLYDELIVHEESFGQELACLMRTKHRNIVRCLGYCADTQGKMVEHEGRYVLAYVQVRLLCFEYIGKGSLQSKLKDTNYRFGWNERYRIIKGVCQGLRYLHEEKNIVHLDLKPDNILLDREMVPKITDFGLSRLFDKQQSRIITKNCRGTRGYMAPEYLDNGVITFKSDIYSMGVIILEILIAKNEKCNVENVVEIWKNRLQATLSQLLLEAYCHQVKTCAEIALSCVQDYSQNRPDIGAIITMLNETETDFQEQEISTSFNLFEVHPMELRFPFETETDFQEQEISTSFNLFEVHPMELRFPFEPNRLATCPLYLANSTDDRIAFRLLPGNSEMYFTEWLCGVVEPRSTYTLTVTMKEQTQHPALDIDEFLIQHSRIMDADQLKDINQGEADDEFDNFFEEVKGIGVDSVHELTLMALCDPQAETNSEVISTVIFDKMVSMDVHPTEPWIVTGHFNGHVCMWNYKTKAMVNSFELTREQEVKFLAQKQWIVAGGGDGCIYVYSYNTMKRVKSFRALSNQITSLAIHPTKPYILSASYDLVIKMWDWENGWKSTRKFEDAHSSSVMQIAFNPMDVKAFASVSKDDTLKIWRVDSPHANFTLAGHTSHVRCLDYFTRGDRQYLITGSDDRTAKIWDMQKKICIETLEGHANRVSAVCSHPELPILMTGSRDGTVRLWNSNSFRLEGVLNFGLRKVHALACLKDSRVVIGHSHGLAITEIGHHGRW